MSIWLLRSVGFVAQQCPTFLPAAVVSNFEVGLFGFVGFGGGCFEEVGPGSSEVSVELGNGEGG
jgi:hypothetical protein